MKSLSILLGVSLSALWLLSLLRSVEGQPLYYDEPLVKKYARITQQLRHTLNKKKGGLATRVSTLSSKHSTISTQINQQRVSAMDGLTSLTQRVAEIYTGMGKILTPAMAASVPNPYTSKYLPLYSNTLLDHGFGFTEATGKMTVPISGIYELDEKLQTSDYYGSYSKVTISRKDGSIRYTILLWHDWEITPFFYMLDLEAGDEVWYMALSQAGNDNPWDIQHGIDSNVILRFLGKKAS